MDGLEYIFDENGNFKWFILKDEKWIEASKEEIAENKALICVQTYDGQIFPADNYYENIRVESIINQQPSQPLSYFHYEKRNTYSNPTDNFALTTSQNLSDKNLYMVIKTNREGEAGSNQPLTIVYSNYGQIANSVSYGNYGDYDYQIGMNYDSNATMDLSYLQKSGLPLPYGEYYVQELNPQEGYELKTFDFKIDKNLTTFDRFSEITIFENGIEKDADKVHNTFGKQQPEYVDSQYNSLDWIVEGEGFAEDTTWLNKQFHIFKESKTTTEENGEVIENELHKQRLRILKKDASTSHLIQDGEAEFMLWQWNDRLAIEPQHRHAIFLDGEWIPYIEVLEYADDGQITNVHYYGEIERTILHKGHTLMIQDDADFTDINGRKGSIGQWIVDDNRKVFKTDYGEVVLDSYLPIGNYFIMETKAPQGYVLKQEPIAFEIDYDQHYERPSDYIEVPILDENGQFVCKEAYPYCNDEALDLSHVLTTKVDAVLEFILEFENEPQMGYVEILKKGEKFKGFEQYFTPELELLAYRPTWSDEQPLPFKATFAIYAQEDIVVNGHLKYEKGECVQIIETDQNGHAASQALYLGKYIIKEIEAPDGYVSDGDIHSFELSYGNQLHQYIPNYQSISNKRQSVQFNIYKEIEHLDGSYIPAEDAIFGIFANEDLVSYENEDFGSLIPNEILESEDLIVEKVDENTNELKILGLNNTKKNRFILPTEIELDGELFTITQIAPLAFSNSMIESITLPNTIEFIGEGAFANCQFLRFLEFTSKKSPYFDGNLFDEKHLLTSIIIPSNTMEIYDLAFIKDMADGTGVKDGRLMGIPLIDSRNAFDEDEEFTFGHQENSFINHWEYDDEFEYEEYHQTFIYQDQSYEVNGLKLTDLLTFNQEVAVPDLIDGKPVVAIAERLFDSKEIKEIILPTSIGYIGESAFANNEHLNKVTFYSNNPKEIKLFIHENAFNFSSNFKGFDLLDGSVEYLDNAYIMMNNEIIQDPTLDGYLKWNSEALDPVTFKQGSWEFSEEGEPALLHYPITLIETEQKDLDFGIEVNPDKPYPSKWLAMIEKDTLLEEIRIVNGKGESQLDYPQGKYYVKELVAPKGYWLDEKKYPIEFKASGNDMRINIDVNNGEPIINYPIDHWSLRVRIHKTNEFNRPLENAEFILWDEARENKLAHLKTDANGFATSNFFLEIDSSSIFWLQEIKAPDGYDIQKEWIRLQKDEIGEFNDLYWDIQIINYQDTPPSEDDEVNKCIVIGNKKLENNFDSSLLEKVIFGVYADEDIFENHQLVYRKDELIQSTKVNKNGDFKFQFKSLPTGNYYVKEIETALNYQIDISKYPFTYNNKDNEKYISINNSKPIINYPIEKELFEIQILKLDYDEEIPLTDVTFGLYSDKDEEMLIISKNTDQNGRIVFENCLPGRYYVKELKAKDGYFLKEEWIEVELQNDNIELTITNRKEKTHDQFDNQPPYTGINNLNGFKYAWLLSIVLLVLITIQKKKS